MQVWSEEEEKEVVVVLGGGGEGVRRGDTRLRNSSIFWVMESCWFVSQTKASSSRSGGPVVLLESAMEIATRAPMIGPAITS